MSSNKQIDDYYDPQRVKRRRMKIKQRVITPYIREKVEKGKTTKKTKKPLKKPNLVVLKQNIIDKKLKVRFENEEKLKPLNRELLQIPPLIFIKPNSKSKRLKTPNRPLKRINKKKK